MAMARRKSVKLHRDWCTGGSWLVPGRSFPRPTRTGCAPRAAQPGVACPVVHKGLGVLLSLGLVTVSVWLFMVAPIVMAGIVLAAIAILIVLPDLPW